MTIADPAVRLDDGFRFAQIPEALLYDHRVTATAVRVYGCLLRHGLTPDDCYPSHGRIGSLIGVKPRSVQRPLRELEEAGWIERLARFDESGARRSDAFLIRSTALLNAPPASESAVPPASPSAEPPARRSAQNDSPVNESPLNERDITPALVDVPAPDPGPDVFDSFWSAYPRKVGKPAARRAFRAALRQSDVETIAAGLRAWVDHWAEIDTDPQFIPYPSTWLNQHRFDDTPPPVRSDFAGSSTAAVRRAGSGRDLFDILTQDMDDGAPEIPETTNHRPLPLEGF